MGRYIKYIREIKEFDTLEEIQEYYDSIIKRGYEIVYYKEKIMMPEVLKIIVVLGKLNTY